MDNIKLIAFDLDDTLLNKDKELTGETKAALLKAHEAGIELVPATGRFYTGIPEIVRDLPFIRYYITINGALVYDAEKDLTISTAELPFRRAVEVMEYLDTLPVIYDCYIDSWGWMTESLKQKAAEFSQSVHTLESIIKLRNPVPELKAYVAERGRDVQKIQLFINTPGLKEELLNKMPNLFPDLSVTSSIINNIEINSNDATKGRALLKLAEYLGISRSQTMAFGDGLNDVDMILAAGTGVAMENACPELKEAADIITSGCNENGVAAVINTVC